MAPLRIDSALIPAAGYGTRLLPASKSVPKELLPVFDRPCLQYAIDEALACGIHRISLVTQQGKGAIEDYLDARPDLEHHLEDRGHHDLLEMLAKLREGLEVTYVRQERPCGLGHAVLKARPLLGSGPFAVLLADDLVGQSQPFLQELLQVHAEVGGAVVGLYPVSPEDSGRYGMVRSERTIDDRLRITGLVEKPPPGTAPSDLAVIGRYVLPHGIFEVLERLNPGLNGELQLTDALDVLARQGLVHGVVLQGRRLDAGTPLGLLEASLYFAWQHPELRPALEHMLAGFREEHP